LSVAAVAVALLPAAGCSGTPAKPAVAPMAAPAQVTISGTPLVDDPPGTATCGLVGLAVRDATLMQPGNVNAIVSASHTTGGPVGEAAKRLAAAYASALAAHGTDGEPDAVAAVSAAAVDMTDACKRSGLDTVG
jgi:hypothetical protein